MGLRTDLSRWINKERPLSQEQLPHDPSEAQVRQLCCSSVFQTLPSHSKANTVKSSCLPDPPGLSQSIRQGTGHSEGSSYLFSRLIRASPSMQA